MFCVYINVCGLCTYENMRMCFYSRAYMWEKREYASKYEINMSMCVYARLDDYKCVDMYVFVFECLTMA